MTRQLTDDQKHNVIHFALSTAELVTSEQADDSDLTPNEFEASLDLDEEVAGFLVDLLGNPDFALGMIDDAHRQAHELLDPPRTVTDHLDDILSGLGAA
jgi:hypothetical protein